MEHCSTPLFFCEAVCQEILRVVVEKQLIHRLSAAGDQIFRQIDRDLQNPVKLFASGVVLVFIAQFFSEISDWYHRFFFRLFQHRCLQNGQFF